MEEGYFPFQELPRDVRAHLLRYHLSAFDKLWARAVSREWYAVLRCDPYGTNAGNEARLTAAQFCWLFQTPLEEKHIMSTYSEQFLRFAVRGDIAKVVHLIPDPEMAAKWTAFEAEYRVSGKVQPDIFFRAEEVLKVLLEETEATDAEILASLDEESIGLAEIELSLVHNRQDLAIEIFEQSQHIDPDRFYFDNSSLLDMDLFLAYVLDHGNLGNLGRRYIMRAAALGGHTDLFLRAGRELDPARTRFDASLPWTCVGYFSATFAKASLRRVPQSRGDVVSHVLCGAIVTCNEPVMLLCVRDRGCKIIDRYQLAWCLRAWNCSTYAQELDFPPWSVPHTQRAARGIATALRMGCRFQEEPHFHVVLSTTALYHLAMAANSKALLQAVLPMDEEPELQIANLIDAMTSFEDFLDNECTRWVLSTLLDGHEISGKRVGFLHRRKWRSGCYDVSAFYAFAFEHLRLSASTTCLLYWAAQDNLALLSVWYRQQERARFPHGALVLAHATHSWAVYHWLCEVAPYLQDELHGNTDDALKTQLVSCGVNEGAAHSIVTEHRVHFTEFWSGKL